MRKVGTMVSRQRVVVNGRDGAGVDICALNQVVDEKEEQHSEIEVRKGTCYCDTFYQKERRNVLVVLGTRVWSIRRPTYRRALQINKMPDLPE